jgi:hypothetical protein
MATTKRNSRNDISRSTVPQPREPITLERAALACPSEEQADRIADAFGLDQVASGDIRTHTRNHLIEIGTVVADALNERALAMHLQRVTGSFVTSAYKAGMFYGEKARQARELNSKLYNEDRDEDRDGPVGFESKAQRAREFAAMVALQAHGLLAAAEGAVAAYEHLIGEPWKPYVADRPASESVGRQAAELQIAALG